MEVYLAVQLLVLVGCAHRRLIVLPIHVWLNRAAEGICLFFAVLHYSCHIFEVVTFSASDVLWSFRLKNILKPHRSLIMWNNSRQRAILKSVLSSEQSWILRKLFSLLQIHYPPSIFMRCLPFSSAIKFIMYLRHPCIIISSTQLMTPNKGIKVSCEIPPIICFIIPLNWVVDVL